MSKKKAIKLVAATAIAASSFAAVAPHNADAATNVSKTVSDAQKKMYSAYTTYFNADSYVKVGTVEAKVEAAKEAYYNAKAVIKKHGGSKKSYYYSKLDSYKKYITRAEGYVKGARKAYYDAKDLKADYASLVAAAVKGDSTNVKNKYNALDKAADSADKAIKDAIYGAEVEQIVKEKYTNATKELLEGDIKVFYYYEKALYWINKGDLTTADKRFASVKDLYEKMDKTSELGKATEAFVKKVNEAYEASNAPKVLNVDAVNAKTIEVKFNKALDAKTLKDASNLDVITVLASQEATNAGAVTQELSEDGKTLTLKATNIFKGKYTVKVPFEIVKDTAGKFVGAVNEEVTVNDTAAPVLVSAQSKIKDTKDGLKKITLTFDEEVSSIDTVKIDGTNYSAAVDGNTATVTVDLDATKAYQLTVVNATDAAGNVKDVQVANLNVTVDNVAPSITKAEAVGENKVKVTVDKELKDNALTITGTVGTFTANIVDNVEVDSENNKEYIVTLNSSYLFKNGNSDTVTLKVLKDQLSDELGNVNAADITKTVTVSKDASAPTVSKVETIVTEGKVTGFKVAYNEEVANVNETKISAVNAKGEILNPANLLADVEVSAEDAKTVIFTLANDVAIDKYSFDLAEAFVQDKALSPNDSVKHSFTVDVTEAGKPVETSFTIEDVTAVDNIITVDYGVKVKATGTGSSLNPSAYQVNGVALPSNTVIEFAKVDDVVDQTTVVITLPAGFVKSNDDQAIFRVTGVQTLDNKVSNPFMKTVAVSDNTAPEVKTIVATDLTKLTVTYSEAVSIADSSVISDEITLLDSKGASVSFTDYEVTVDGKLVLTVTDSSLVSKIVTNKVEAADTAIKDAEGNAQKAELTVSK